MKGLQRYGLLGDTQVGFEVPVWKFELIEKFTVDVGTIHDD